MKEDRYAALLEAHNVKPTANRLLVARALGSHDSPLSLRELETKLVTVDKSSIFRTLVLFREHHLVHDVEDGEGCVKYELCLSSDAHHDTDEHVHFYCTECHQTYCFEQTPVPPIDLPAGFRAEAVNYMVKGQCPVCGEKQARSARQRG